MNMREKFKKLFTLAKKSHDGFTLVELIVVMAILAVLGGIGIPAYSAYVEEANITADETLAAEVKHALLLAHYEGTLAPGSSVIITTDQDVKVKDGADGDSVDAAMQAAFESDYKKDLRLSWDGWNLGVIADSEMMGYLDNSTFKTETLGNLLEDVELVVGIFNDFVDNGFDISGTAMGDYMTGMGIDLSNSTAVSNGAVLYTANDIATSLNTPEQKKAFAKRWARVDDDISAFISGVPDFSTVISSENGFSSLAAQYAFVEGYATYIDKEAGTHYIDKLRSLSNGGEATVATIQNAMSRVYEEILGLENEAVARYFGRNESFDLNVSLANIPAYSDAMAFLTYMQGLDSSSNTLIKETDLSKDDFYTNGDVLGYVTNYVSMGKALRDNGITSDMSAVIIYYNGNNISVWPID